MKCTAMAFTGAAKGRVRLLWLTVLRERRRREGGRVDNGYQA